MKSKYLHYLIFLLGFTLLFSLVSCTKKDWSKDYREPTNVTRAMYITPDLDCNLGESIMTKRFVIQFKASGMYLGEDPGMKGTEEYKYIFLEYEIRELHSQTGFLDDDIDVTDYFYLLLDEAAGNQDHSQTYESREREEREENAESSDGTDHRSIRVNGVKADASAAPDVPAPGPNRRRVYFKVPAEQNKFIIYFQDTNAQDEAYHFLYEGLYSDWWEDY